MFCKTCGKLLLPKKTEYGKWLSCPAGHPQPELNQDSRDLKLKNVDEGKKIEVASDENRLAVYDHQCRRCGYGKAQLMEMSANYTDEDNIYRYKCGKCGFVEQLEGKVG